MDRSFRLIAISGGIGSGKSVVAKVLRAMGFPVFDCDREAARIMDNDSSVHSFLCSEIHPHAVNEGKIDRPLLAKTVFSDSEKLKKLNSAVHAAVFDELRRWCSANSSAGDSTMFVESAILHSSGLVKYVDEEWRVTAPVEVRIERVIARSGLTEDQIRARIDAQAADEKTTARIPIHIINNGIGVAVLPRLHELTEGMQKK